MANVSFNPQLTSAPLGTFQQTTQGYIQGDFVDDPALRLQLSSGVIASSVTQPVWGGMVVEELVNANGEGSLGTSLALAAGYTTATGITVFTQAYNMIIVPGNSVQTAVAGMTANFFRFGSGARIKVQCSSALLAAIEGGAINQQVSWDFVNQQLVPFSTTALPVKVLSASANSQVVSYNSGTGAVTWVAGDAAVIIV